MAEFQANNSPSLETEELLVNMGPQHPSTHGVLRLVIRTDGEMVRETWPQIGYLHRCFEKIGQEVDYPQSVPYTDRMDYLASMNNAHVLCMAFEKLGGFEVPERFENVRYDVELTELQMARRIVRIQLECVIQLFNRAPSFSRIGIQVPKLSKATDTLGTVLFGFRQLPRRFLSITLGFVSK